MSPPILEQALAARVRFAPLTVDQYHRMIETGILPEGAPLELLDGMLVRKDRSAAGEDPMTIGKRHGMTVDQIAFLLARLLPKGFYLRCQGPLSFPPEQEPEPDAAVIKGQPRDYAERHPGAADVPVVIEVADSSLAEDRTVKQRIYANAGIPQYVLVNIPDQQIELHEQPLAGEGRYGRGTVLKRGDHLRLLLSGGQTLDVSAEEWLP
jgi:Uma2 family endonuclease